MIWNRETLIYFQFFVFSLFLNFKNAKYIYSLDTRKSILNNKMLDQSREILIYFQFCVFSLFLNFRNAKYIYSLDTRNSILNNKSSDQSRMYGEKIWKFSGPIPLSVYPVTM